MINPYAGINWSTVKTVPSVSHAHSRSAPRTMNLVNLCVPNLGNKIHLNLSNYHGSYPLYPLTNPESLDYNEKREWCRARSGDPEGYEEAETTRLAADHAYVPLHLQEYIETIDLTKIIECPNAEHHRFRVNGSDPDLYNRWHMNSVGSMWGSGHSRLDEKELGNGAEIEWTLALDNIFANLLYEDGGGVTINHPNWSHSPSITHQRIVDTLDYDPRVLGVEIYNDGDREATSYPRYADNFIDPVLMTGRRCWIFAVPDHMHESQHPNDWRGVQVLLVPAEDNHECLKAYRNGNFYAKIMPQTSLMFTSITYNDGILNVDTTNASKITLIIDGKSFEFSGSSLSRPVSANNVYCRIKAETNTADDIIFSNPIMLNGIPKTNRNRDNIILYS